MSSEDNTRPDPPGPVPPDSSTADILQDVREQGVLPPQIDAQEATSAVFCVLSQRLSSGGARKLLQELPPSIQAMVQPCAIHAERIEAFDNEVFIRRVAEHLDVDPAASASIARGVFAAVIKRLPEKQLRRVGEQIPDELQSFWGPAG